MAYNNDSGGIGILGVLVGALIVIVIGAGLLFYSGQLGGGDTATVNVDAPKATTGTSGGGSGASGGASKSAPSAPAPSGGGAKN